MKFHNTSQSHSCRTSWMVSHTKTFVWQRAPIHTAQRQVISKITPRQEVTAVCWAPVAPLCVRTELGMKGLWTELGGGLSSPGCLPFPSGQGLGLLRCPSATTVPLFHMIFQDRQRISPPNLPSYKKVHVSHKTVCRHYSTTQSKISGYFFK